MSIPIAFSPCPNDTFLFHAWVHNLIDARCEPSLHDIEQLNQLAIKRRFPLIKVSFGCLPLLLDNYAMLPVGAALGHGCGPVIVAREPFNLSDLSSKRIAIPGASMGPSAVSMGSAVTISVLTFVPILIIFFSNSLCLS